MKNNDIVLYAINEYINNKRSFHSIGKELGKNPKIIRDWIIRAGYKPRSRSQAQKIAIQRNGPPIKGPRSEETKRKISLSHKKRLSEMEAQDLVKLKVETSEKIKQYWNKFSKEERSSILKNRFVSSKKNNKKGSILENEIAKELRRRGYKIEHRTKDYTYPYEIDIFIVDKMIALEIDGPIHFKPIYGYDKLKKTKKRDNAKNNFLNDIGISVIRVQSHLNKATYAKIVDIVDNIEKNINNIGNRKNASVIYINAF